MSEAALKIPANEALDGAHLHVVQRITVKNSALLSDTIPVNSLEEKTSTWLYANWLAAILLTMQFLDGILTYVGIITFGIRAEGNPLLRGFISIVGVMPAIAITKLVCMAIIMMLCAQAHRIAWLPAALTCIAGLYAVGAVLPWSWLLLAEYFA